jgi:hypothetical protein
MFKVCLMIMLNDYIKVVNLLELLIELLLELLIVLLL